MIEILLLPTLVPTHLLKNVRLERRKLYTGGMSSVQCSQWKTCTHYRSDDDMAEKQVDDS